MQQATWFRPGRTLATFAAGLMIAIAGIGCDGEQSDRSAMVMQPAQPARPAAQPMQEPQPQDELADVPVYISIDGEPYEFPPAKLWLKRTGNRVRARLLSDDPPEALDRNWSGDSFYFEMDMELSAGEQIASHNTDDPRVAGQVTAADLEAAEWIFRSESSDRTPTNGIFLGSASHLQPISVNVLFDHVDENTVMVTLEGLFADFDPARPSEMTARRQVRVQAALPAAAIAH